MCLGAGSVDVTVEEPVRGQKRTLGSPKAGNTGCCGMPGCVVGIKSRSSARAANALDSRDIAPAWTLILNITDT